MHSRPTYLYLPFLLTLALFFNNPASSLLFSQAPHSTFTPVKADSTIVVPPLVIKPTFGIGLGMLSFLGDKNGSKVGDPQYGRIGYQLTLAQRLSPSLTFSLNYLSGSLAANQHLGSAYLNFESQIRSGSFEFEYNFDRFFKNKSRRMSPYVSLGFESFEFLSKTDMYDASGNKYYFWNDGTIRNIDQHSANASNAVLLKPDYTYETDLRTLNKADYGKYSEFAFAIPVGAGALFHLSSRLDFKIGTTIHFTFTDYIDGLPAAQAGPGKHYDKFLFTSCMLRYDLNGPDDEAKNILRHQYDAVDFAAIDQADEDNDGVTDLKDSCLGTPAGVAVNQYGCPLDTDGDGVPDYLDKEPATSLKSIVDVNGVAMSDTLISEQWDRFNDSTMKYAAHVVLTPGGGFGFNPKSTHKEYTVLLGTFKKGLSTEKMTRFLSIEDVRSTRLDDSTTVYTAGRFTDLLEAEKRKNQLLGDGMPEAKVVYEKNGKFLEPEKVFENKTNPVLNTEEHGTVKNTEGGKNGNGAEAKEKGKGKGNTAKDNNKGDGVKTEAVLNVPGVVFRIQLGAFKHRIGASTFDDAGNVLEFKGDDGLYKYLTGSFSNFNDAAKYKVEMLSRGYQGAFIAAYKNGKRIPLTDVGAIPAGKMSVNDSDNVKAPAVKKDLVVFKV